MDFIGKLIEPIVTHNLAIKTTIHHTDTVSVIVACSLSPVAVDVHGVVRLSNALTRVEERLLRYIECAPRLLSLSSSAVSSPIPDHDSWIVTMWHFGYDSPTEYVGKEFEVAWEDGQNALFRIYTKDLNGVTKIRKERQEYPNKRFDEAIDEKLPTVISIRQDSYGKYHCYCHNGHCHFDDYDSLYSHSKGRTQR